MTPSCFLAQFSDQPCQGALRKVHLIPKQKLRQAKHDPWDERAWIYACGGEWPGLGGHHGALDFYRLRIPREKLPAGVLELAAETGLGWYLEERFL